MYKSVKIKKNKTKVQKIQQQNKIKIIYKETKKICYSFSVNKISEQYYNIRYMCIKSCCFFFFLTLLVKLFLTNIFVIYNYKLQIMYIDSAKYSM